MAYVQSSEGNQDAGVAGHRDLEFWESQAAECVAVSVADVFAVLHNGVGALGGALSVRTQRSR